LVQGLIPAQSQTIWQGRPKVGKSHTLLQLAYDAGAGLPVFGRFPVPRPVRTAYVELEEPEALTKQRYEKMLDAQEKAPDRGMLWFLSSNDLYRMRWFPRELLGTRRRQFYRALKDEGIEMLIMIALRRFVSGDPNEPTVAESLNDALDELHVEAGVALLMANHTRKASAKTAEARGFGSTMFAARADAIFDLSRAKGDVRRVQSEARYDAPSTLFLERVTVGNGEVIRVVRDPEESQRQALSDKLAKGISLRQAAKDLKMSYGSAHRLANG